MRISDWSSDVCSSDLSNGVDAFQGLYTEIANDIAAYRKKLSKEDHAAIRQVAELKFGTEFAPDAYNGYLMKAEAPEAQGAGLQKVRSEERRVGNECVSKCRSRWSREY